MMDTAKLCVESSIDHVRYVLSFPARRSSDLMPLHPFRRVDAEQVESVGEDGFRRLADGRRPPAGRSFVGERIDRKSTRLNSSHPSISYAVFCLKKKIKYIRNLSSQQFV